MTQIAAFYKENTPQAKKLLIQSAREIMDDIKPILAEAKKIADNCSDKRLRAQLLQALERIPFLSQQLKIVAAVKAANPLDLDSDKQLITCAQNLMNAVKATVQASESASIRAFKVAGNAAVAVVKFKRALYKKSQSSKQPPKVFELVAKTMKV
jgi:vinculin